jgi:ABC-2 type transport system permease protein
LLRQKAIASGILSAAALVLLPLISLGVGVVFYGAGAAISPTGDAVSFGSSLVAMLLSTVYIVVQLAWVAGLALLLSVSTDAPLGAVGGAVLAAILSQILDQITALGTLRNYLPTHYSFAWIDLISTDIDWTNMASGILSSVIYATVFGGSRQRTSPADLAGCATMAACRPSLRSPVLGTPVPTSSAASPGC